MFEKWELSSRRVACLAVLGLASAGCLVGLWQIFRPAVAKPEDSRWVEALGLRASYISEARCVDCHPAIGEAHSHSAHRWTSSRPGEGRLLGHFEPPNNVMKPANLDLRFVMEKSDGHPTQTAEWRQADGTLLTRSEQFDVVIGSGRKGQTSLYWEGDELYELPVTWWTESGAWMNSPGYPDGTARFDRGSSNRCLECHASRFESKGPPRNRFEPSSMQLGISCQTCHGPGSAHVEAVEAGAEQLAIVNPAKLPPARRMDLCSLCHGGRGQSLTPPGSYVPGDDLSRHLRLAPPPPLGEELDPHGSQLQGLMRSPCFQKSEALSCNACHDGHAQERQLASYARSCLSCHGSIGQSPSHRGPEAMSRCVDCHMPSLPTNKIILRAGGLQHRPEVRSHTIGIYPELNAP